MTRFILLAGRACRESVSQRVIIFPSSSLLCSRRTECATDFIFKLTRRITTVSKRIRIALYVNDPAADMPAILKLKMATSKMATVIPENAYACCPPSAPQKEISQSRKTSTISDYMRRNCDQLDYPGGATREEEGQRHGALHEKAHPFSLSTTPFIKDKVAPSRYMCAQRPRTREFSSRSCARHCSPRRSLFVPVGTYVKSSSRAHTFSNQNRKSLNQTTVLPSSSLVHQKILPGQKQQSQQSKSTNSLLSPPPFFSSR
jgi:hypothetical protein